MTDNEAQGTDGSEIAGGVESLDRATREAMAGFAATIAAGMGQRDLGHRRVADRACAIALEIGVQFGMVDADASGGSAATPAPADARGPTDPSVRPDRGQGDLPSDGFLIGALFCGAGSDPRAPAPSARRLNDDELAGLSVTAAHLRSRDLARRYFAERGGAEALGQRLDLAIAELADHRAATVSSRSGDVDRDTLLRRSSSIFFGLTFEEVRAMARELLDARRDLARLRNPELARVPADDGQGGAR